MLLSLHSLFPSISSLDERAFRESEAPLTWIFDLIRRPTVHFLSMLPCVTAVQAFVCWKNGFAPMAFLFSCVAVLEGILAEAVSSARLQLKAVHMLMAIGFVAIFSIGYLCLALVPAATGAVFIHRSCGMVAVFWRVALPYFGLHMRESTFCLIVITIVEVLATHHVLAKLGHGVEAFRILIMLTVFSCGTPLWCYFNTSMWHALWSAQVQLAAEKESSKSLLSVVCDATFWLGRDGDTILRSTRQFDAILGRRAEQSRLSHYIPAPEVLKVKDLASGQDRHPVTLLPTSVVRDGQMATNVDLFIVPCRPAPGQENTLSDPLESLGFFIGLRLAQSFVDSSETSATDPVPQPIRSSDFNEMSALTSVPKIVGSQRDFMPNEDHLPAGIRQRKRVTFSDNSDSESSSATASISKRRSSHFQSIPANYLASPAMCSKNHAFSSPFKESQSYLKECVLSELEDLASSLNFHFYDCCPWHGNLNKIGAFLEEMRSWHKCDDGWPSNIAHWQCGTCSAVVSRSQRDDFCWLCDASRVEHM